MGACFLRSMAFIARLYWVRATRRYLTIQQATRQAAGLPPLRSNTRAIRTAGYGPRRALQDTSPRDSDRREIPKREFYETVLFGASGTPSSLFAELTGGATRVAFLERRSPSEPVKA